MESKKLIQITFIVVVAIFLSFKVGVEIGKFWKAQASQSLPR